MDRLRLFVRRRPPGSACYFLQLSAVGIRLLGMHKSNSRLRNGLQIEALLLVTVLGRLKSVTLAGVSLYLTILSVRQFFLGPKNCQLSYSVLLSKL